MRRMIGWMMTISMAATGLGCGSETADPDAEERNGYEASDMDTARTDMESRRNECEDDEPPLRCSADPATFDWRPAAIVDSMFLEGTEEEPICCVDFTGDGKIDNSLGHNFAGEFGLSFRGVNDINGDLQASISTGEQTIILEFDPLTSLEDESFQLNWWDGSWAPTMAMIDVANHVLVRASSAAWPRHYFPTASLSGERMEASDGQVSVELNFFGTPLSVQLHQVHVTATLGDGSGVPAPGVELRDGRIGAIIPLAELYAEVNRTAAACSCLGLEEPLLDELVACNPNADGQACAAAGEDNCTALVDGCNLYPALGLIADVDVDADGFNDAISVGFSFTAAPATIDGVVP